VKAEMMTATEPTPSDAPAAVGRNDELSAPIKRSRMDSKTLDVLWRHTLFNPDRTEDPDLKAEEETAAEEEKQEYTFEIRGIVMFNDERRVLLQVTGATKAPPTPPRYRYAQNRPNARGISVRNAPVKTPDTKRKNRAHMYSEGDAVEDTGYVVSKIEQGRIVLTKDGDELVVEMDTMDESSQARRTTAAKESAPDSPNAVPVAPKTGGSTPSAPPPPPPMVPGTMGAVPTGPGTAPTVTRLKDAELKRQVDDFVKRNSRATDGSSSRSTPK
jgi:hypothetical protein